MKGLLLIFLALFLSNSVDAACLNYTEGYCTAVIIGYEVAPAFGSIEATTMILDSLGFGELISVGGNIDPVCAQAGLNYACGYLFQKCEGGNQLPLCKSSCERYHEKCFGLLSAMNETDKLLPCDMFPDTGCNAPPYSDELPPGFECPHPLIQKPANLFDKNISTCVGACCIPCTPGQYFYEEGKYQPMETLLQVFAIISLFLDLFVLITYLLMKEKRTFPSNIITCLAGSLFIFYFTALFNLRDPRDVRCLSPVELAEPEIVERNGLCVTQSIFLIYGILASVMWYFLLVLNVYVSVIFLSKKLRDYRYYYHGICWTLPLISVIIAAAQDKTGYVFGFWCAPKLGKFMTDVLMAPMAVFIFPSVPLNLHVLLKIFWVARKRNASLPAILRLQIRFFCFVMAILFVFLFYWIHFEVRLSHLEFDPSLPWIQEWFHCIAEGKGQNACAPIAVGNVPELVQFGMSEFLVNIVGVIIFGFFGLKAEIWIFWKSAVTGAKRKIYDPFNTTSLGSTHASKSNMGGSLKGTETAEEVDMKDVDDVKVESQTQKTQE